MGSGHILAIPYPAQGHVIPLLEFSLCLAKHGFKITFVNTEYIHKRVVSALAETNHIGDGRVHLVSLPDGLKPWEDRNNLGKLTETMLQVMPVKLEELINTINGLGGNKITGVIADENLGWALEVAAKMKIPRVAFWPAAAALLAMQFSIPNLIEQKLIDSDGKKGFDCFELMSPSNKFSYPSQGHVIPLLEFSLSLAKQGFEIMFVNTEHNHKHVMGALAETNHIGDESQMAWNHFYC